MTKVGGLKLIISNRHIKDVYWEEFATMAVKIFVQNLGMDKKKAWDFIETFVQTMKQRIGREDDHKTTINRRPRSTRNTKSHR